MFASGSTTAPANAAVFKNMLVPENHENITVIEEILADNVDKKNSCKEGS